MVLCMLAPVAFSMSLIESEAIYNKKNPYVYEGLKESRKLEESNDISQEESSSQEEDLSAEDVENAEYSKRVLFAFYPAM